MKTVYTTRWATKEVLRFMNRKVGKKKRVRVEQCFECDAKKRVVEYAYVTREQVPTTDEEIAEANAKSKSASEALMGAYRNKLYDAFNVRRSGFITGLCPPDWS